MSGRNILPPTARHILLLVFTFWVRQVYWSQVVLCASHQYIKYIKKMTMKKMSNICWTSLVRVCIFIVIVIWPIDVFYKLLYKNVGILILIWTHHKWHNLGSFNVFTTMVNQTMNMVTVTLDQKSCLHHFDGQTFSFSPAPDHCSPAIHVWSSSFMGGPHKTQAATRRWHPRCI